MIILSASLSAFMLSGLLFSLLLLFLLWLSASLSCVFFLCLSVLWLLLLSSSLSSITFLFRFSVFVLCGFCLCRSGLLLCLLSSALSSSVLSSSLVFCFRFFYPSSALSFIFCLLLLFCFISSVSVFFCIGLNNSALVFCLHKKKNGGSFTAIDFFYSLVYLFGMISYFTSMILSSKMLFVLLSYITIEQ